MVRLYSWLALLAMLATATNLNAQSTQPPEGLRNSDPDCVALVGARLVLGPDRVLDKGTLVIRQGVIIAAGHDSSVPADARVIDAAGRTIYPGFIDAYGEIDIPSTPPPGNGYWNPQVSPTTRADLGYATDAAANKKLRSQGFTVRLVAPRNGIIKGTSALVALTDATDLHTLVREQAALHIKLTPRRGGPTERGEYPTSPMGALALIRQAFYDADWYRQAWAAYDDPRQHLPRPQRSDTLQALQPYLTGEGLVIIDAPDELYFLRADQLAKEFKLNAAVRSYGFEYRRLDAIKATGRPVIVPVEFSRPPNVKIPELAAVATLEDLMHWDLAPENPGRLEKAGVRIALTTHGLRDTAQFLARLRQSVKRGLSPEGAVRALTLTPAELLGVSQRLGTLDVGKTANLVVTDGDLFAERTSILETWIDGRPFTVKELPDVDLRGKWEVTIAAADKTQTVRVELKGEPGKLTGNLAREDKQAELSQAELDGRRLFCAIDGDKVGWSGRVQLSATVLGDDKSELTWLGMILWASGEPSKISARRVAAFEAGATSVSAQKASPAADKTSGEGDKAAAVPPKEQPAAEEGKSAKEGPQDGAAQPKPEFREALFPVNYPLGIFGRTAPPEQPKLVVFQNATIWTCGPQGVLTGATLIVEAGKIKETGVGLAVPEGAVVFDLAGRHITPGIIDCHSHIATDGGVNESGQTITAEVRIGDFIDPDDVNIYRQLAGGVTAANILHGSANTIGGQNQVIKFRWGGLPEELKFAQAPPGIKFALGENVKQSNWGDRFTTRYPQTRMGVEQLVRDAFEAALAYRASWDRWNQAKQGMPPRVDLELQALAEVVSGSRLIHCHAYRQDEILALMRTCEAYKVRIATFQHILEGYKVADVMARHGVGGSSFSDWWAYKFEVYDAIPYNGALLHNAGIVVSFNSDDAELARRLNLEAAKAVKYGGVPEAEALKFVTLNAAKQLGIDRWVGSLEGGKDADLAIWSGSPLSTFSRCEQTWIDGRKYFDRQEDAAARQTARQMRAALVQRVLASGASMAELGDDPRPAETLWPREDLFCGHHDHDRDEHE
jgi:N-acetylglucosamine-6-phosphate deacetylase